MRELILYSEYSRQEVHAIFAPAFYASASEVRFATEHADRYYLYRVFEFDQKTCSGKVFVQKGILAENFSLEPVQFKVELTPRS
jgi:hypothetical protein